MGSSYRVQKFIPLFLILFVVFLQSFFLSCSGKSDQIKADQKDSEIVTLGEIQHLLTEKRYHEAIDHLKKIIEKKPNIFWCKQLLAQAYQQSGDIYGAIDLYEQLVSEVPYDSRFRWEICLTYFKMGLINLALEHLHIYVNLLICDMYSSKIV